MRKYIKDTHFCDVCCAHIKTPVGFDRICAIEEKNKNDNRINFGVLLRNKHTGIYVMRDGLGTLSSVPEHDLKEQGII